MEPELAVLVGLQASGKSTFVASRFAATHTVVSKDLMRSARHKERRQRREISMPWPSTGAWSSTTRIQDPSSGGR